MRILPTLLDLEEHRFLTTGNKEICLRPKLISLTCYFCLKMLAKVLSPILGISQP